MDHGAFAVERLEPPTRFTAGDVLRAMHGHRLAEAVLHATYSLNPGGAGPARLAVS